MPADFSALFDSLLVIAGLVLVVTGVVMFIRSKTASAASSVEAFGIKLNVTHPSLILVLAGVGLMLAPRLLPDSGRDDRDKAPPVVAEVAEDTSTRMPAEVTPAATPKPADASGPAPDAAPATPPQPAAPAVAKPPIIAPPMASPAKHAPAIVAKPAVSQPAPSKPSSTKPATSQAKPAAQAKPAVVAPRPAPQTAASPAQPPATAPPAPTPPPIAKPARPVVAYAALGLPVARDFWRGETQASLTGRMHAVLRAAGPGVLRMDARTLDFGESAFDAWWNESNAHPKSRALCEGARALFAARLETPVTISSVESAYWPELRLRLYDCAAHRVFRQQKTLAPHRDDTWPFSVEFNNEVERFLRTYRTDLEG